MTQEKKEKEPLFTQMEFNDAQYAMEIKQKCETKLAKVKLGLLLATVAEIAWVLIFAFSAMPDVLACILMLTAIGTTVAAYIWGGGLKTAFRLTWKIAKGLGWFGWYCVPFPADIFTGILLTLLSAVCIPVFFIFIPLVLVFCNYVQINKDFKAADEYLKYCTPVANTYNAEVVAEAPVETAEE